MILRCIVLEKAAENGDGNLGGGSNTGLGAAYYFDPATGSDIPSGGTPTAPWKTVTYAAVQIGAKPAAQQVGAVLNLRGGQVYPPSTFPSTLKGTDAQPIVVQPWPGVAGGYQPVTFDAGLPELRQPNNNAWEQVPGSEGGVADEWCTKQSIPTPNGARYAWGQMMVSKYRLINYTELGDLRAQNESYAVVPLSDPRSAYVELVCPRNDRHPRPAAILAADVAGYSRLIGGGRGRYSPRAQSNPGRADRSDDRRA